MSHLYEHVLVLNKQWSPVDTCTVANAFSKLFAGTAKFLDVETYQLYDVEEWIELPVGEGDRSISTQRVSLKVPEVMVLTSGVSPKRRTMQFSRKNLVRRDNFQCQYCGDKDDLTVEHVVPRKKGGKSTWTNCVMACLPCNSKKADKTMEEAQMSLLPRPEMQEAYPADPRKWTLPYEPAWSPVFRVSAAKFRPSWSKFLPEALRA